MTGSARIFYGKYRGIVVNNEDPMGQGRIQVRVPEVTRLSSSWAVPSLPVGIPQAQFQPPAIGADVWVEFERGRPDYPIWVGNLWNAQDPRFSGVFVEEVPGPLPIPGVPTSERVSPRRPKIEWPREEFPVKVEGADLNAEPNDVPIEPIELPEQNDEDPPDD